ncbi:TetR/AcrR family transcriptional regulator [Paenibacillus psychroresistens]|uniref:TetR/AcrR family transcriptional regulator n=1 Tax=Paenibacillus psychroresistens TaxID=1778678 RepID=A0A6B8RTH0_9BACL|nr:TetR/AcrR family transcriptional regulator [Paenibacillus psychroresistens]QGQ99800.1 TetR/AcrR family transcriptional regulator [Paenibacillus psychroresistens]
MARTKAFDKNEVLHKAMSVFGSRGYEGATLPDLITGLGIARQSLYDTYGTKRDLFLTAVKYYMDRKNHDLQELLDQPGTVTEKVEQAFSAIIRVLADPILRRECFIISSAIEQASHDEELAAYMHTNNEQVERGFYTMLELGVEKGELSQEVNIRDLSWFLAHERLALVSAAKLGMDEQKLVSIMQIVLSVLKSRAGEF